MLAARAVWPAAGPAISVIGYSATAYGDRTNTTALDPDIAGRLLFLGCKTVRWNGSEHRGIAFYLPDAGPTISRGPPHGQRHRPLAGHRRLLPDLPRRDPGGRRGADAARDVQMDLTDAEAAALQGLMRWKAKTPAPEDFAAYERVVGWLKEMPA